MNLPDSKPFDLTIIGAGLAGSEAALQAASRGIRVRLFEMRPETNTGVHTTANFAELVCSNSLGSSLPDRASGCLQHELKRSGSFLIDIAQKCALPAGRALAVDRTLFSLKATELISSSPNIEIIRQEVTSIPEGVTIIASGPLTSPRLAAAIADLTGEEALFFFDAVAPIIDIHTIDFNAAFRASRYQKDEDQNGDYVNLPFTKEEYYAFVELLTKAKRATLKPFEIEINSGVTAGSQAFFEGCLPVEVLATRGVDALAFGPMRPVGLVNPRDGHRPFAVIQLRQDNISGDLYNLVGFQTNLTIPEQERVLRTIPGMKDVEFIRYGQMHRNTYLASPLLLYPNLQMRKEPRLFFAGQITGVEGYAGNIATGLLAGRNAARLIKGLDPVVYPPTSMIGALCNYITACEMSQFQPMKANFGILPELVSSRKLGKREKAVAYYERSMQDLDQFLNNEKV